MDHENEEQYIWRLGQAKDSGQLDMSWEEIAELVNIMFRDDESEYRSESAYRKIYSYAKKFFEAGVFNQLDEESYLKELQAQKDAIYKEKRKLFDQRREYNKLLISDARADHLTDSLLQSAKEINDKLPLLPEYHEIERNVHKVGLLCLTDWHYGLVTDNIWNYYDTNVCKERIRRLTRYTIEYLQMNHIDNLFILVLGDLCHGSIHVSCRVQSEENTCDQLIHASELLAETINELSGYVHNITVFSCYGNHMRTIQNKNDSIHSDNMEKVIPWWLKQRLQNNSRVHIVESEFKEFTNISLYGYNICAVHGDLDSFKNLGVTVNSIFSKKFDQTIDYTISGDKHHLEEFEQFGIESILVRSLCGTDDYANNKRLYSKPGQTLIIFNDEYGRESTYHIPLE